jgi:hypothetical protein
MSELEQAAQAVLRPSMTKALIRGLGMAILVGVILPPLILLKSGGNASFEEMAIFSLVPAGLALSYSLYKFFTRTPKKIAIFPKMLRIWFRSGECKDILWEDIDSADYVEHFGVHWRFTIRRYPVVEIWTDGFSSREWGLLSARIRSNVVKVRHFRK